MSDSELQTPLREGLPPTYRMRADAHYVDLIEGRATNPQGLSAAPAHDLAQPSSNVDATLHAGRELEQALATLTNCAALLTEAPSTLSRAVVGDLMRAEAWRASALLHATRVVRGELPIARAAFSASGVLDKVTLAFQPERRVRAVAIEARFALPYGAVVVGDQQMVAGAMSWAVLSSLAILDGRDDSRLTVAIGTHATAGTTFSVSQSIVTPPPIWQTRAFDPTWTDRPGGVAALVWMLALRETAQVHGGSARVERSNRGTTIGFSLPSGV